MKSQPAPITQMVVTLNFGSALAGLNLVEVVRLYEQAFEADFPVLQPIPPAGPMSANLAQVVGGQTATIPTSWPRLRFSSEDHSYVVMLQFDRLSFGWARVDEEKSYPGHTFMFSEWTKHFEALGEWVTRERHVTLRPQVAELVYENHFAKMVDGSERRLSEMVTFFKNPRQRRLAEFSSTWFEMPEAGSDSYIQVVCETGYSPSGEPGVRLEFTGLSSIGEDGDFTSALNQVHREIEALYYASVSEDIR